MASDQSPSIFISYSRQDQKFLDELVKALGPFARQAAVTIWCDQQIKSGDTWERDLQAALEKATAAILLVSHDFLASPFIMEVELPYLLRAAAARQLRLLWIPVRAAAYDQAGLTPYQAVIDPRRPLDRMSKAARIDSLVRAAREAATPLTPALTTFPAGRHAKAQEEMPSDYFFLNHTSFLRRDQQARFRAQTGEEDYDHYDIRVIVDSYYEGALERVSRVEYILGDGYPQPTATVTKREKKFMLYELAWGSFLLTANVYLSDREQPVVLHRFMSLTGCGPDVPSGSGLVARHFHHDPEADESMAEL